MWAEETAALCLRWMDPDSSTTSVWKPMSGLNGFPLLISSSIPISVLALSLSLYPTLHLSLCCNHFSSATVTRQQSPFQPFSPFFLYPQYAFPPFLYFFSSLLLNILPWAQRYCRKGSDTDCNEEKTREREKKDSRLDASPAVLAVRGMAVLHLRSYSVNHCIFQNTQPSPFVYMHSTRCLEGFPRPWMQGCSRLSLMSRSAVEDSAGPGRGDARQARWMDVVI